MSTSPEQIHTGTACVASTKPTQCTAYSRRFSARQRARRWNDMRDSGRMHATTTAVQQNSWHCVNREATVPYSTFTSIIIVVVYRVLQSIAQRLSEKDCSLGKTYYLQTTHGRMKPLPTPLAGSITSVVATTTPSLHNRPSALLRPRTSHPPRRAQARTADCSAAGDGPGMAIRRRMVLGNTSTNRPSA